MVSMPTGVEKEPEHDAHHHRFKQRRRDLLYWPTSYSVDGGMWGNLIPEQVPVNILGFADVFGTGSQTEVEFVSIDVVATPEPAPLALLAVGGGIGSASPQAENRLSCETLRRIKGFQIFPSAVPLGAAFFCLTAKSTKKTRITKLF